MNIFTYRATPLTYLSGGNMEIIETFIPRGQPTDSGRYVLVSASNIVSHQTEKRESVVK